MTEEQELAVAKKLAATEKFDHVERVGDWHGEPQGRTGNLRDSAAWYRSPQGEVIIVANERTLQRIARLLRAFALERKQDFIPEILPGEKKAVNSPA